MFILNNVWPSLPKKVVLNPVEIHIWLASFRQPASIVNSLSGILSPDEQKRANRFHFAKDKKSYIIGRGLLRQIIGEYQEIEPRQIRFCYSKFGKPFFQNQTHQRHLNFNLSHSKDFVLFGFVNDLKIGIDIEYIRPGPAEDGIAERFFTPNEVKVLRSLPLQHQRQAFYLCWTRKEAYIKANEQGLSMPLDQFEVSLALDRPAK
ncbi:MAG: 4'-phosphopantetheinyl transferase superfamily protein [bacterium]|nr:4'-phosphopantetheinyl transferase superfamily protein [bacterium]